MKNCPLCNAPLTVKTEKLSFTYKGQTYYHTASGEYCKNCDEMFFEPAELDKSTQGFQEFKKQVNKNTFNPDFIKSIRKKLGLSQKEAGIIFGGGVNVFSRYEHGKATPQKSLLLLLKLLDKNPSLYQQIKEIENI